MAGWADVVAANAATPRSALRLVRQLGACEAAAIAFCRLLERWGRGDAVPATPGARGAALPDDATGGRRPDPARREDVGPPRAHTSITIGRIMGRRRVRS